MLAALTLVVGLAFEGCGHDDPEQLWNQARADWSARRFEQAEAALSRIAASRPLTLPERLLRAQVARDRGHIDEAVAALGEVPPDAPPADAAVVLSSRGTLELLRHRFHDAETVLKQAITLDPARTEARRELVNLYALQSRTADLASQAQALSNAGIGPKDFAEGYLWTVGHREDVGPPELAEALAQAVAANPDDQASRIALADNLRRLGRLDEVDQVLAPLPSDDPRARAARARLALDRGSNDDAEAILNVGSRAVLPAGSVRSRDEAAVACLRGRVALAKGNAAEALKSFQDAYLSTPDDRETLSGLAQAQRLTGNAAAARASSEAASARDRLDRLVQNARPPSRRTDPATLREIGEACEALNRPAEARAWYRLALARDPLDPELQKRLFHLDRLSTDSRTKTSPPLPIYPGSPGARPEPSSSRPSVPIHLARLPR